MSPDARMAWWREARFGLFVHWGLYAILAGEWKGGTDYGEWIRDTAQIPVDEYEKLKAQWNPTGFDADEWLRLAKEAGMRYIVVTTKHHDGFCLFDSKLTDWQVMGSPWRRDAMRELAEAARKYRLRLGWYHSIMDWHHPDYLPRRGWEAEARPAGDADFSRYEAYLHGQVSELLENYGPVDVMWFDGEWEGTWNDGYGARLEAVCRRLMPDVVINNRVSNGRAGMEDFAKTQRGDFTTPEQSIPPEGIPGLDWESCMTMNRHWGWNRADTEWKSVDTLVQNLVDCASKGGNYLLNVGPTAEGIFPPLAVERLAGIGAWMKTNGEAIYGTTASPFPEAFAWGRVTAKAGRLYLHVFDAEAERIDLPMPPAGVDCAWALSDPERQAVAWQEDAGRVVLHLPESGPPTPARVFVLETGRRG